MFCKNLQKFAMLKNSRLNKIINLNLYQISGVSSVAGKLFNEEPAVYILYSSTKMMEENIKKRIQVYFLLVGRWYVWCRAKRQG